MVDIRDTCTFRWGFYPGVVRGDGDGWVLSDDGAHFWGRYGAAGLLLRAPWPGGSAAVQIGAFSSTAVADREYAAVAARFPSFARNATKRVQEVTASNGSTVYRTTFTGLSAADARAFCAAIQAGGGDCLVR